jgi:ABC-2 type transport system permease protein
MTSVDELGSVHSRSRPAAFVVQTRLLTRRLVDELIAAPAQLFLAAGLAVGFVVFQDALLGGSPLIAREAGDNYVAFILPAGMLVGAAASGMAGYLVAQDMEDGYLDRLLTMPLSRATLVLAPITAAVAFAIVVEIVVLIVGAALGAAPVSGLLGAVMMVLLGAVWALGVAGYMVVAGLLAREITIVRLVEVSAFFLLFMSPALLKRDDLSGWVRPFAAVNPTTYVIEALRELMLHGWRARRLVTAFITALAFGGATIAAAMVAARRATRRR